MNRRGTYSALVAVIALVIIVAVVLNSIVSAQGQESLMQERAIVELKAKWQNLRFVLDKVAADAIADSYDRVACGPNEDYADKINAYFTTAINNFNGITGADCSAEQLSSGSVTDGTDFSFALTCNQNLSGGGQASYSGQLTFNKSSNATPGAVCELWVRDNQSLECEVLENTATC